MIVHLFIIIFYYFGHNFAALQQTMCFSQSEMPLNCKHPAAHAPYPNKLPLLLQ